MNKWLVRALLAALCCGCSAPGQNYVKSGLAETLAVELLPNGSKMFTYRLRLPDAQIPSYIGVSENGSDPRRQFYEGGIAVGANAPQKLEANAAYVVRRVGYCREGFFTLDRSISRYDLWLRGECKEGASGADQNRFGTGQVLEAEHWRAPH